MKTHTNNFKNEIKKFGREIDSKIMYGTTELGKEQLNSVTPHYEGSLLKSVMKQLDVDSNVEIPLETVINYQFGVKVGNEYEYLNYGNYVVYKAEKQEDTRSWKITCYDKMLYSMKDYENLGITYPITVRNYLQAICTKIGLTLSTNSFENEDKQILSELYLDSEGNSLGYTYRDVLDEIAQATGSVIFININDELEVGYPSNAGTYETVEGSNLSLENVDDVEDFNIELQGDTVQDGTPTPENPINVQTVTGRQEITINEQSYEINLGKNLFDKSKIELGIGWYAQVNSKRARFYIKYKPSQKYSFTLKSIPQEITSIAVIESSTISSSSGQKFSQNITNEETFTHIFSSTAKYLIIQFSSTNVDITREIANEIEIQLEIGVPTHYSPYKTPIELCKRGDYKDKIYKENEKWYLYKEIGKCVLDGTTNMFDGKSSTNRNIMFYTNFLLNIKKPSSDTNLGILMSSHFENKTAQNIYNTDTIGIGIRADGRLNVGFGLSSNISTLTLANQWLNTNNVIIYYVLETPTTEEITDEELIEQLEAIRLELGVNNISVDSGDLSSPLKLTYLSELETINEEMLKNVNVNFGEKFGPVNSVVLSRSAESDNIYRKDDESIEENGLTEIKIKDNQILNGNNRDEFIDGIFNRLKDIEYYVNDYVSTGIAYLELLDFYKVKIEDNTYKCLMLNDELDVTQGLEEPIHAERMEDSETDYKNASKTDRTINQAYIIVKKNEAEIEELASKVVDVSNTISGIGNITLDNAYKGILHRLEISGNISSLLPNNNLTPNNSLVPIGIYVVVDETRYLLDIDFLNYTNVEEHDTFIYEDGKCWIERINGTIEEREGITIYVEKNSEISIEPFTDAHLFCEYLLDNKYTSIFANQVEVSSELNLLADTIEAKVSQVADEDGNVTSASIILAVNNDTSQANIQADKINMNGLVTANENFKILQDGSMEAKNGIFKGEINGGKILINGNFTEQDPYIRIENSESTGSAPIETNIWTDGISCINYAGVPVIRTENADGFAELSGSVVNAYGFNNVSLEERKKNFDKLENALKLINEIDIYKYNYKEENDDDKKHIGIVIGKDYKYSKEITSKNNKEIDIYSFVSVCCKAIQELQQEIEELRKEIK